jgi:phage FluMu gp28-like protein
VVAVVGETAWHLATLTWKRTAFAEQKQALEGARERFGWDSLTVDATGLGTQLAEELVERWGSSEVRPLVFTPAVKERLYTRLYRWLAGDRLRLAQGADGERLRGEAVALQRVVTASGGISYEAPRGRDGHGDRLTSLALALDGAGEPVLPVTLGQRPLTAVA